LPDKSLYPDYYTIIKHPIAMDRIKKRIHQGYYPSPKEFKADFIQMFDNARLYNVEGSEVYEDAVVLQQVLEREYQRHCPNDAVQILLEDRRDEESFPKSNTASPTSAAGPLKIKFKMSNGDV
jgi:ATP-dependent helicase STH1/SNF2